ncbi:MAG: alpha-amylase family protein [Planctomyces sp.]|nr:alpha-amylase family protein [Planctomyces sp.]
MQRPVGTMSIEDLWYKHAIIYCLDVETYLDANGDGVGDFDGLRRRLDYLAGLGVTCLWLQPFHESPNRDNGYDVADYYSVNSRYGTLGDYVAFMNEARALGMRVIVDLVVSHTSIDHPWFQAARKDRKSPFRDWYVWSDERPEDHDRGIVFPGAQQTNWTWDEVAGQFYFHRFYEFQADLNAWNPAVREEIQKIMGFWLELGASGFRMDAVPFLIERKRAGFRGEKDYTLLQEMRDFLQWRRGDAILLAEANVLAEESPHYFGETGDRLQMMLNFPVNQRLFYALATADVEPLREALQDTRDPPQHAQWVQFLRSHDELDLGRLTELQRQRTFEAFGPEPDHQIYDRGLRRRLAPMLHDDPRRLRLALSLLFALPGTPMIHYGDEIGIGEDLSLQEREAGRTPMQWSNDRHGGFSKAGETFRPVVSSGPFAYSQVNVARQLRDRESLLNFVERTIRIRQQCPAIGWGGYEVLHTETPEALAILSTWRGVSVLTLHNFSPNAKTVDVRLKDASGPLVSLFDDEALDAGESGGFTVDLSGYGFRWFNVGGADLALEETRARPV